MHCPEWIFATPAGCAPAYVLADNSSASVCAAIVASGRQAVKSADGLQYAQNMASAILAALPLVVVFLFFQRQIIKGIATTGFGGQ
jgi:ABC-type glycerol-3-phosphate transport system permease component